MSTLALLRNPSRIAAAGNAVAWLGSITRWLRLSAKVGKDRRTLQALPDYMLADMGLERLETHTTLQSGRDIWQPPQCF